MLGIKYNNSYFDLYPGAVITLELNNPVFDDDTLKGNYSFPFKIPLTPLNRSLLNFPDIPGSIVNFNQPLIVDIYIEGLVLFPAGELLIKGVFTTFIDVYILVGISRFSTFGNNTLVSGVMDYIKELSDLAPGETGYDAAKDIEQVALQSLSETVDSWPIIFFPVVNSRHYDNTVNQASTPPGVSPDPFYNYFYEGKFYGRSRIPVNQEETTGFAMVPFIYNSYLVRKIFENYNLQANIFDADPELKKMVLLNSTSLDAWKVEGTDQVNTSSRNIDLKNHVPDMAISDYLLALKKMFCLYLYQNPFRNEIYFDTIKSLLESSEVVDWGHLISPVGQIDQEKASGIKWVPDPGGDGMINNIETMKGRTVKFTILDSADLPGSGASPGDIAFVENRCEYWQRGGLYWELFTSSMGDYFIEPSTLEVGPKVSGAVTNRQNFQPTPTLGESYFFPKIEAAGSYIKPDKYPTKNKNVVKLAFYRGMQNERFREPYPFATAGNFFDRTQVGNYTLSFFGTWGLYWNWWKGYINFRSSAKTIKVNARLSLVDLLNMDMRRKVRIEGDEYFIKKITLQLPLNKPSQVELMKDV